MENCVGALADQELELAAVLGRQLCFLLFAPNILDSQAAGRNKYLDVRQCAMFCRVLHVTYSTCVPVCMSCSVHAAYRLCTCISA